jgi:hypothetical protein
MGREHCAMRDSIGKLLIIPLFVVKEDFLNKIGRDIITGPLKKRKFCYHLLLVGRDTVIPVV